jgi:hypothetical protein
MLDLLRDNGGPTPTMALLPGSPAIDAGDNTGAPKWDQRGEGFPRVVAVVDPDNPVIDIGAFEVQAGAGPGRPALPAGKPLRLDVAAPVAPVTWPGQPLTPDTTKAGTLTRVERPGPGVAAVDQFFRAGAGVPRPDAGTVHDSRGGNDLSGNGPWALLFSDGLDSSTGFDPASQQVPITP